MFNIQDVFHNIQRPDSGIFEPAGRTKLRLTSKRKLMNNRTERAFKFNETLRHISASEELINRVYNIFKMIFHNKSCKIKCHYMEKNKNHKSFLWYD